MDWTNILNTTAIPAVGGALVSLIGNNASRRATSSAQGDYDRALNYLIGQQNLPYQGYYGQGGSVGDSAYDNAVRAVALGQLGQQLEAARLNIARGNLTDRQARAKQFAQEVAQRKATNDGAMNYAAKAALRLPAGTGNMKSLYSAGLTNGARGNNAAYANAMNVIANNDANYQVNPAYMDAINQQAKQNDRLFGYNNAIAGMMAQRPNQAGFSNADAMMSGLFGGAMQGWNNYNQYRGKKNA